MEILPPKQRRTHLTIRMFMSPITVQKIHHLFPLRTAHASEIGFGSWHRRMRSPQSSVLSSPLRVTGLRATFFFFAYGPMVISEVSSAGALFRSYGELESISGRMTLRGCPAVQLSWTWGPRRVEQNMAKAPKAAGVQGCFPEGLLKSSRAWLEVRGVPGCEGSTFGAPYLSVFSDAQSLPDPKQRPQVCCLGFIVLLQTRWSDPV